MQLSVRHLHVTKSIPIKTAIRNARLCENTLISPKHLKNYLDEYVIGQESAKRSMATCIYNHYLRVKNLGSTPFHPAETDYPGQIENIHGRPRRIPDPSKAMLEKSNILVHGPTGTGKTLIAKTLANVLNVPFSISDCSPFTQTGYVGEDVEMSIYRLLAAADWDIDRAECGIVCLDEFDKLARAGETAISGKDIAGEGVQQAFLKILEGTTLQISPKGDKKQGNARDGVSIDTSNILFILTGAFVGLDEIISSRLTKSSMGFNSTSKPYFTSNTHSCGLGELLEPADLIKFGFLPELVGRVPVHVYFNKLSESELYRIILEPRNALIKQYKQLFSYSGVELHFTQGALEEIAKRAYAKGTGARGLRNIMENVLQDAMFESPGSTIRYVLVTSNSFADRNPATVLYFNLGEFGKLQAIQQEDMGEQARSIEKAEPVNL